MTDYSDLIQPDKGQDARPIHLVDKKGCDEWLKGRSARERAHLAAVGFKPEAFVHAILPGDDPENGPSSRPSTMPQTCRPGASPSPGRFCQRAATGSKASSPARHCSDG